jgi:hypothetical protein
MKGNRYLRRLPVETLTGHACKKPWTGNLVVNHGLDQDWLVAVATRESAAFAGEFATFEVLLIPEGEP